MKTLVVTVLVILCGAVEAGRSGLKVTFGMNPFRAFKTLPVTQQEALNAGFSKLTGECSSGAFVGNRYMKTSDPSVILLFDINGFIAGIQTAFPKNSVPLNIPFQFNRAPFESDVINGQEYYILTAYFVSPGIVCTTGRTRSQFDDSKSGDSLIFKNGTSTVEIPISQSGLVSTNWTPGKCFVGMGKHYWYNMRTNMDCGELFPAFLLYDHTQLHGFGFAVPGYFQTSTRYEHPPTSIFPMVIRPVPNCLYDMYSQAGGFTTLHVYFGPYPYLTSCPLF